MPGARQPTDVIIANGKKHLSMEEENKRRAGEVKIEKPSRISPPKWLPEKLEKEFKRIGKILASAGLYTELDRDSLAMYLIAQSQWLISTIEAQKCLQGKNVDYAKSWINIQEKYFKQARCCANDLGLTISSRCRLVIPPALHQDDASCEDEFTKALRERQKAAAGG